VPNHTPPAAAVSMVAASFMPLMISVTGPQTAPGHRVTHLQPQPFSTSPSSCRRTDLNRLPVPAPATCPLHRDEPEPWTIARGLHR